MRKDLYHAYLSIRNRLRIAFDTRHRKYTFTGIGVAAVIFFTSLWGTNAYLIQQYKNLESPAIEDRNGTVLTLEPNPKQKYGRYIDAFPTRVKQLLVEKEDRFFYWHPGINPVSTLRATGHYLIGQRPGGASTITQQLVKNLLGNEQSRSFLNKIVETFGAFSLECE